MDDRTIDEIRSQTIKDNGGFITEKILPAIIEANRLEPLLVRCGGGRFLAAADQIGHFIAIIERPDLRTLIVEQPRRLDYEKIPDSRL